jgi:DNA polymerase-3 subunit delta'
MIEPRDNPFLAGQDAAEATLADAMRSGRLHHGWLISGPEGVGKATLAFRFARRLFAGVPPHQNNTLALDAGHVVFRRVAAGTHADLLTVARAYDEKRKRVRGEIVVDDVRRVAEFLRLTPAEGGWRIVIVDGAEHLNRNAANALLKVLEEPPARAILLLTCAAPGRLLPTIRSRCRQLTLPPLDPPTLAAVLARYLPDLPAAERARLADIADGSPGRALALAGEQGVQLAGLVDETFSMLPQVDLLRAHAIADTIARSETGFSTFMDLLRAELAKAVREAGRKTSLGAGGLGQRLAAVKPLDAWVDVWHGLTRLQSDTERFNLDKRQALIQGLSLLRGS